MNTPVVAINKPSHWKQANAIDQLTTIRMALEGNASNFFEGIIDKDKFQLNLYNLMDQLETIDYYIRNPNEW